MRIRCFHFLFLLVILGATSCVLEKRHYMNGYYLNWTHKPVVSAVDVVQDTTTKFFSGAEQLSVIDIPCDTSVSSERTATSEKIAAETHREIIPELSNSGPDQTKVNGNDEPKPEEHDKVNPKITWLTVGGIVLELSLSMILLFGTIQWVGWFVLLAMLAGIGLFVLARHLRATYVMRTSSGVKDEKLRVSAHYHRFKVLLHMYFAAGAIGLLGWFFLYTAGATSGILSLLGVILFSSGVVLLAGVGLVLLVLLMLYFFRWRRDPTGYKPPRDPHPPKDR